MSGTSCSPNGSLSCSAEGGGLLAPAREVAAAASFWVLAASHRHHSGDHGIAWRQSSGAVAFTPDPFPLGQRWRLLRSHTRAIDCAARQRLECQVVSRIFRTFDLVERHPALAHVVMAPLICWSLSSSMLRYLFVDHAVPAMWRSLAAARLSAD